MCSAQASQTEQTSQLPKTAPQEEQILSSYEGQSVSAVSLAGRPDRDAAPLLSSLQIRPGDKFSEAKARATLETLKRVGGFRAVRLRVEPDPKGVTVRFVLEPAMYYGVFRFTGAEKRFGYARLVQITNYPPRGAFDAVDVQGAADDLVQYFNRNGYFLAEVSPKLTVDEGNGLVNIDFVTSLGRRAKFGKVNIEG